MPGAIVHFGAGVTCSHAGVATAMAPNARVMVSGQAVVTIGTPYAIAGCSLASGSVFCTSGQWVAGATRVFVMGVAVAVQAGSSVCVQTGQPMLAVGVQPRVVAT